MLTPSRDDYLSLLKQLLQQFFQHSNEKPKGRPTTYSDFTFISFFLIMQARRCLAFRAMHRWLISHKKEAQELGFNKTPHLTTISRRYKALYEVLVSFIAFVADWANNLGEAFQEEVLFEDKSLFKAQGPVWHKKDMQAGIIPVGLRNVDRDATWSKSGYHGWLYGYGLHTTTNGSGFPKLVSVETASVSEHTVFAEKVPHLLHTNAGYLVGDDGYTNLKKVRECACHGLVLLTQAQGLQSSVGQAYQRFLSKPHHQEWLAQRKVAIEPVFDLISRLLGTRNNHKQLPLQRLCNVRTFLALGVFMVQLAMIINTMFGLPLREISHLLSIFG